MKNCAFNERESGFSKIPEKEGFEGREKLLDMLGAEITKNTVQTLRKKIGELAERSAPYISKTTYAQYKGMEEGRGLRITMELLQTHSELFKSKVRREALKRYALIQQEVEKGNLSPQSAHQLIEKHILNKMTAEFMEGSLEFGEEHLQRVTQLTSLIEAAKKAGHISLIDEKYWMDHYVLPKELTLKEEFFQIEAKFKEKMKNRKADKDDYDDCKKHPAVQTGQLKHVLLDEAQFLKAEVPQRHAFLKGLAQALENWDKQEAAYEAKLQNAVDQEWIFENRATLLLAKFAELSPKKREEWLIDPHEMNQRKALRLATNRTEGGERADLEIAFQLGDKAWKLAYENIHRANRLYLEALTGYLHAGVIGQKTFEDYAEWIPLQPLQKKMQALSLLHGKSQMGKLMQLRKEGKTLSEEQQAEMRVHHHEWGFTALKAFIEASQKKNAQVKEGGEEKPLRALQHLGSSTLAQNIESSLEKLSLEQLVKFRRMLNQLEEIDQGEEGFEADLQDEVEALKQDLPDEPEEGAKTDLKEDPRQQLLALNLKEANPLDKHLSLLEDAKVVEVDQKEGLTAVHLNEGSEHQIALEVELTDPKAMRTLLNDADHVNQRHSLSVTVAGTRGGQGENMIDLFGSRRRMLARAAAEISRGKVQKATESQAPLQRAA